MAFDIINRQNGIAIFIKVAVDPMGDEDRTKDENLCSENSLEAFLSEARDEIITCRSRLLVDCNIARSRDLHK